MTLRLGELEAASGYGEPYVSLDIPGEWKVSFTLRCGDSSLTWEMRLPVTLYGQEALVTEASLSPLSYPASQAGSSTKKVIRPSCHWAQIRPWCSVTMLSAMERPRPKLPSRLRALSTR